MPAKAAARGASIADLVAQIHAAPQMLVYEFAGAGSLALHWLHSVGGSSRTVLEATDHYANASTSDALGHDPEQFVSAPVAAGLAQHAYQRAQRLAAGTVPVIGIGCSAAIATDYVKRGAHRCAVAVCTRTGITHYACVFRKGTRSRAQEEDLVSRIVLRALAEACGLPAPVVPRLNRSEPLLVESQPATDALDQFLQSATDTLSVYPDGHIAPNEAHSGVCLLSGSFNPLHDGHVRLLQVAAHALRRPALFELPVLNAEKGLLNYAVLQRRLSQFKRPWRVALTHLPLFEDKASMFPNSVLVIGYDTAVRLLETRFYSGSAARMRVALDKVRGHGCSFLVAGRLWQNEFRTLRDITLPAGYADLFAELPEAQFRVDTSSTMLRATRA